jgi:hypothetical protein
LRVALPRTASRSVIWSYTRGWFRLPSVYGHTEARRPPPKVKGMDVGTRTLACSTVGAPSAVKDEGTYSSSHTVRKSTANVETISYKIVMAHRITTPSITFFHRDSIAIRADRAIETLLSTLFQNRRHGQPATTQLVPGQGCPEAGRSIVEGFPSPLIFISRLRGRVYHLRV